MFGTITIALSKGRIFKEALPLFAKLDIKIREGADDARHLILDTNREDIRFIVIRASDVPTYVAHGAADLGVAGKDVLIESTGAAFYEPLDLKIAKCKMILAGVQGGARHFDRPRVATKYVRITRDYFAMQGRQAEVIKLYGSMELAPVLGLADQIVDLVDTGATLRANGLEPLETIAEISSRLIINKAAMKIKSDFINPLIQGLDKIVNQ